MTEAEEKPVEPYSNYRWKRSASNGRVLIKAFIEKSSTWETIIEVHASTEASVEKLSDYVFGMIVQNQARLEIFEEARAALELVDDEGLTFSSEHAVDRVLSQMKNLKGMRKAS